MKLTTENDLLWMHIANREKGVKEVPGDGDNPRIREYHGATAAGDAPDAVAWCSSFVNWCMQAAGVKGTRRKNARSWAAWGDELHEPLYGCVVVLTRGPNPSHGHVGFYVGDAGDSIKVLGGNQGNRVSVRAYAKSRVLTYRWPAGVKLPVPDSEETVA